MSASAATAVTTKDVQDHVTHFRKHHAASGSASSSTTEEAKDPEIPIIPKGCKPLPHQVAGHRFGQGKLKLGMLQHADGSIMKPVQPPPRGECEVNFYSKVFDPKCEDPVLQTLRPFLPKFCGVCYPFSSPGREDSNGYLKLEDACRRFRNPSILDVKIGRVSYDPHADAAKIAFESGKYPPMKNLGFQLLGARVSGPSPNEAIFYDKKWGRSFSEDNILDGLEVFFSGNKACQKHIIKAFLERLETILIWFESQSQLQFYSSSLLLIYEGEFFDGSSDSDEEFMHKYRSFLPSGLEGNECFRAIDKILQTNIIQDVKELALQEKSESPTPDDENENESLPQQQATTIKSNSTPDLKSPSVLLPKKRLQCGGVESGYSSEAESKKKAVSDVELKTDFVSNISRRMRQHALVKYKKYRFPLDLVDIRMIDFTHVFEDKGKDENYLYGLRNFIAHLRHLLKRS